MQIETVPHRCIDTRVSVSPSRWSQQSRVQPVLREAPRHDRPTAGTKKPTEQTQSRAAAGPTRKGAYVPYPLGYERSDREEAREDEEDPEAGKGSPPSARCIPVAG